MIHLTEEEIAQCSDALQDGTFDRLPKAIRTHLAECDACASEVSVLTELMAVPAAKTKHVRPLHHYAMAGAAALLAAVLLFFWQKSTTQHEAVQWAEMDPTVQTPTEPIPVLDTVQPPKEKPVKRYAQNVELEKLRRNFEGSYRSSVIDVLTPSIDTLRSKDRLVWNNPNGLPLFVEILDHTNHQVQWIETSTSYVDINCLPSGLYYWKLFNEEYDLLYCGKIIVQPSNH